MHVAHRNIPLFLLPFLATGCLSAEPVSPADMATPASPDLAVAADGGGGSPSGNLWIPPMLTGKTFDLKLAKSSVQYRAGNRTTTYGYNGLPFWGPTLVVNKGDMVQMNVTNQLTEDTTTHWHGFHIPAAADGGPHQVIAAGTTWSPSFQIKNDAATYWYHPHLHTTTVAQLTRGAGGFIIIRDPAEAALALPRTYGVDDIPIVFTSRRFLNTNEFDITPAYGDYLLANGVMDPQVTLPAQVVRLRILNGEIERAYNIGISDGRKFYQIATDGGLVNAPVALSRAVLYPGERIEILIDLSADKPGTAINLMAYNANQAFGFGGGEPNVGGQFGSLLNNKDFPMLRVTVGEATPGAIRTIPQSLANNTYWSAADATVTQSLSITDKGPGTPFTFDGLGYDANRIDKKIALDSVVKWTVTNGPTFDHSFHIHDVQFKIVARSDGPVHDWEQGWKDTVRVRRLQSVTFVAKFDDFASQTNPYMYHCHMSNHEDEGLMGQFLVQ